MATSPVHGSVRLTADQILLRDAVRILADEQVAPRAADIDKSGAAAFFDTIVTSDRSCSNAP